MKRFIIVFLGFCLWAQANAQPKKRRVVSTETTEQAYDRASLQFPTASSMPEDVVWRRDVYRQLDLTQDRNAPLYYPVEPHGNQVNLFTFLFRMMLDNKVKVYEYSLDGNESFAEKDVIKPRDFLEKYSIYYEENGNRLMVSNSDIPSASVTRMYLKESIYFDQRTSSFHKQVTALCPVLVREDDFGGASTPYPLFWVKYSDAAPFLSKLPMMGSNYNNVTNMTADDYFTLNRYDGKIYKTNNLQGRVLANYCKTDSALTKEQNRIEQELDKISQEGFMTDCGKGGAAKYRVKIDTSKLDIKITHASEVIEMGEAPGQAIRKKKKSSIPLSKAYINKSSTNESITKIIGTLSKDFIVRISFIILIESELEQ